jgi:hypothetical protein
VAKAFIAVKSVAEWRAVLDAYYAGEGEGVVGRAEKQPAVEETCEAPG